MDIYLIICMGKLCQCDHKITKQYRENTTENDGSDI